MWQRVAAAAEGAHRELIKSGSSGRYGLHAKVFVIDGQRTFVGSMNFDQRSFDVNTEIGLVIGSPQIARDIAARFDAVAQPANSYRVTLEPGAEGSRALRWTTEPDGKVI